MRAVSVPQSCEATCQPIARADIPEWLPPFPGAALGATSKAYELGMATMLSYWLELVPTASVAGVATFYRETGERSGLTIVRETKSQHWRHALEPRSADRMHGVYLDMLERHRDTHVGLMDQRTLPRP
jgi:hypothetical protein